MTCQQERVNYHVPRVDLTRASGTGTNWNVKTQRGRKAMPEEEKRQRADRAKAVRNALDLTQEQFADRAGLDRVAVNKIENGKNAVTSADVLQALALGIGAPVADVRLYLDGGIDLEDLLARRGSDVDDANESVLDRLGRREGFSTAEIATASTIVRGLHATALLEGQALRALQAARATRTSWTEQSGRVVADEGKTASDELGGGAARPVKSVRRRGV